MGERAVHSTLAHVFQIDQETKKKWIPSSSNAVKVAFYHDPAKKTYRIIAIDNSKALVNSTITANMNFTKTSPKFGQWSDHRANTVYGLGFSAEKDLAQFVSMFSEAKQAAKELVKERQLSTQRLQDQEKALPPAGTSPSPTSPPIKSPGVISPPVSTSSSTSKSPSPSSLTSPGPYTTTAPSAVGVVSSEGVSLTSSGSDGEREKVGKRDSGDSSPLLNGNASLQLEPLKISSNGVSTSVGSSGESEISPDGQLDSLKSENNRLKLALASSGTNVKKWESELQTLKINNTQLHTALEDSKVNVSKWTTQFQKHKEENESLKKKLQQLEGTKRKESLQSSEEILALRKEGEELKDVLSVVQEDLESKTEEAEGYFQRVQVAEAQVTTLKEKVEELEEDNQNLANQVEVLEDQLKMAAVASTRKTQEIRDRHAALGLKLKELLKAHENLDGHLAA